jgi:hypothetical protein
MLELEEECVVYNDKMCQLPKGGGQMVKKNYGGRGKPEWNEEQVKS